MYQPNTRSIGSVYRVGMLLGWAVVVTLLIGCSDSPERAAQKQAGESVLIADQLIRESQYSAVGAGGGAYQPEADLPDFEQALKEWDQLVRQLTPGDFPAMQQAADRICALSLQILQQPQDDAVRNQRLEEARQTLSDAILQAQQNDIRQAIVGPELMLGALHLMNSREKVNQLNRQAVLIHSAQTALGGLRAALAREEVLEMSLQNRRSGESVPLLNALLDDPGRGLRNQLIQAEAKSRKALAQRNTLQTQYETVQDQADRLLREYVELLNQAEKAQGQQRYRLQLKAYEIRRGKDQIPGAIALEAQAQKMQNELAVLDVNVQYNLLLQDKLRENIRQIENAINQLQDAALLGEIRDGIAESEQQKDYLASLMSTQLNELQTAEEQYIAGRSEAVEAFSLALNCFNRAADAALSPDLRGTRQHAQKMARGVTREWAQLWQSDAGHYDLSQSALASLEQIPPLQEQAGRMRLACQQARDQAQANADQLLQQIPTVQEDITEPSMPFDEPGAAVPEAAVPATIDRGVIEPAAAPTWAVEPNTAPPVITDPNQIIRR